MTAFLKRDRYVVYVPEVTASSVILFLHGAGERGNDGTRQSEIGLGRAIRLHPERVPAIVVFPQLHPEERWLDAGADLAMQTLDDVMREFNGDPDRVYLTGMSLGGYGVWHLALAHPERFAALVPVCGGIMPAGSATSVRQSPLTAHAADPYAFTAHTLRDKPIWMFHGADDDVIAPSESRRMNEMLEREGADVRYTEYAGVGHNSWTRAYAEPELWRWLFEQRRNAAAMPPL